MTYSDKIKELHFYAQILMLEYRIIAREINTYLRTSKPVEQDLIRLQDAKQKDYINLINEHNKLISLITKENIRFTDLYFERE